MTYSPDLRSRVLAFVKQGGSKVEAASRFGVHRLTIYSWLRQPAQRPKVRQTRRRKLDKAALQQHVKAYPDAILRERADHFGVHPNAIWTALRQLNISIKKTLRYLERNPEKRITYLQELRAVVSERGGKNLVYIDETGFAPSTYRPFAWAARGEKVYGERSGERRPRTSLIAAKWGKKLLAPFLFSGTTTADWFNQWLTDHLFKELPPDATLIMDNAAFHKTPATKTIIEQSPFNLLYLPPYSPDFNPIEQDFAIMKKRRQYAPPGTSIDDIVSMYDC